MKTELLLIIVWIQAFVSSPGAMGQTPPDTLPHAGTLVECIQYALDHHPSMQQSLLDQEITNRAIGIKLSDWFPQVTFNMYVQRNPQPPLSLVQGVPIPTLLAYSSSGQFSATQTIFNRDVLLAASTAGDLREQSKELTASTSIDVIVNVSKAFYAVLLTLQQISLLDEDIVRLTQSFKDAYNQYESGVVDKIDYERASIAVNNASAERRQAGELLKARDAFLRQQMGYPSVGDLALVRDTAGMEQDMSLDTTRTLHYDQRIEYRLLEIQKSLLASNVRYNKWSFLPSLIAYGSLNYSYQDDKLGDVYHHNYPSSWIGLQLAIPILQGGKRIQQIDEAELQLERVEYDLRALQQSLNAEFVLALANYKSSLNNYSTLKENLILAEKVYKTIQLQYKAGTKTYLEVITAETDLRTAQVNETDALYQVLSSKLDVQRALGVIRY